MGDGQSPAGKGAKMRRDQPLVPCSILQILEAQQQNQDGDSDDFIIDGRSVNQVSFVGQILSSTRHQTNDTYVIADASGSIEVRVWVDHASAEDYMAMKSAEWQNSVYVKVIGNIRAFGTKRSIVGLDMQTIHDWNQLTYHFLDVIHSHLYATAQDQMQMQDAHQQQQYQDQAPQYQQQQQLVQNQDLFTQLQQLLLNLIGNDQAGLHVRQLCQSLPEWDEESIRSALAHMADEGHLYTTLDAETYAVTDYP